MPKVCSGSWCAAGEWGLSFAASTRSPALMLDRAMSCPWQLDFYCHELRLAVEVDGGQHATQTGRASDVRRTATLKARGIHVLRFSNLEVLQETITVADALWHACQERLAANRQAST